MKWMADHFFIKNENIITFPEDTIGNSQLASLERKRIWEEKKVLKIREEKEKKREHLTATYWG